MVRNMSLSNSINYQSLTLLFADNCSLKLSIELTIVKKRDYKAKTQKQLTIIASINVDSKLKIFQIDLRLGKARFSSLRTRQPSNVNKTLNGRTYPIRQLSHLSQLILLLHDKNARGYN